MKNAYFLKPINPSKHVVANFSKFVFGNGDEPTLLHAKTPPGGEKAHWKFAGVPDQHLLIAYRHIGEGDGGQTDAIIVKTREEFFENQTDFRLDEVRQRLLFSSGMVQYGTNGFPVYVPESRAIEQLAILDLHQIHERHFDVPQWNEVNYGNSFVWLRQALDVAKIASEL